MNVTQVKGIERLNKSFEFDLIFDTLTDEPLNDLLLQSALITFVNKDNYYRHQAGLITQSTDLGLFNKKRRYHIVIKDRLSTLKNTSDSKVFIGVNLKDVLHYLASQAGYSQGQVDFRVTQPFADMPQCVQAMESNWQFFHRLI